MQEARDLSGPSSQISMPVEYCRAVQPKSDLSLRPPVSECMSDGILVGFSVLMLKPEKSRKRQFGEGTGLTFRRPMPCGPTTWPES